MAAQENLLGPSREGNIVYDIGIIQALCSVFSSKNK